MDRLARNARMMRTEQDLAHNAELIEECVPDRGIAALSLLNDLTRKGLSPEEYPNTSILSLPNTLGNSGNTIEVTVGELLVSVGDHGQAAAVMTSMYGMPAADATVLLVHRYPVLALGLKSVAEFRGRRQVARDFMAHTLRESGTLLATIDSSYNRASRSYEQQRASKVGASTDQLQQDIDWLLSRQPVWKRVVIEEYAAGMPVRDIAALCEVHHGTISKVVSSWIIRHSWVEPQPSQYEAVAERKQAVSHGGDRGANQWKRWSSGKA